MKVEVLGSTGWREAAWLPPVGTAAHRTMAVPITLPDGQGPLRVRLEVLTAAWEVDAVSLAPGSREAPRAALHQVRAHHGVLVRGGRQAPARLDRLQETDGRYQALDQGDHLTLSFVAPDRPARMRRTAVLRLSGYYEDPRQASLLRFRIDRLALSLATDGAFEKYAMEALARHLHGEPVR